MRARRVLVTLLAAPWALWALARTLGIDGGHPLVALMSFTSYAAATAIVPVAVALVAREWVVAVVAGLALAALALAVLPRALDGPRLAGPGAEGRPLVVMTANLRFGEADARDVVRLVREHDVDVLSLQELTPEAVEQLDAAGARRLLPARALRPLPSASGTGLMARGRLRALAVPPPGAAEQLRAALALPGGGELGLVAVHPFPPLSARRVREWQAVLRALPAPAQGGRPQVLAGDFNATLDHRDLRRVLERGYTDAADATGDGLRTTFPAQRRLGSITIDHVLVPATILVRRVTVVAVADSDHRALIAELVLPARRTLSSGRARRRPAP